MITEFLNKDYETIILKLIVVSIAWGMVLLAMAIDLYFGIKKANSLNEARSSEGYKRSVQKFSLYYSTLVFALIFDTLIPISYFVEFPLSAVPFVTILAALALIYTEYKSVREKAEEKVRRKVDESTLQILELLKNKEDVLGKVLEQLKTQNNETDTNNSI